MKNMGSALMSKKKMKVMVITPKTETTVPRIVLQNGELKVVE